jgi:predicted amidophosphoribosyltransferase
MAQAWLNSPLRSRRSLILPIPLHAERRKSRGFNQAELLARSFCQLTGCVLKPNGLRRVRATEALFNLSKSAREQMLKDVFVVDRALRSDSVMLFDDIYTTGATVRSAMQALHQQGIQVEGVIVLAKTPAR